MAFKIYPTYSDANYYTRDSYNSGILSGSTQTSKYVAYCNQFLYGLTAYLDTIGTSTYTCNVGGTVVASGGTATTSSQTISVYVVTNTSTTTTAALSTATYGPYVPGGSVSPAQAGLANVFPLNTNTGTGQLGGVYVPQGAEVYFQSGTDATAKITATLDFIPAPLAPFVA